MRGSFTRQTMRASMLARGTVGDAALDFWDQVFDAAGRAVDSSQTIRGFAEPGATGLQATIEIQFDPESEAGKYLSAVRPAKGPLLRKLPDMDALVAFGSEWELTDKQPSIYGMFAHGMLLGTRLPTDAALSGGRLRASTVVP